jgi:hypothetical protein
LTDFDLFWKASPTKVGKKKAMDLWKKYKPPLDEVLKTIEWQKKSEKWKKNKGEFIPHPTTWLNAGRWEDEPDEIIKEKRGFVGPG